MKTSWLSALTLASAVAIPSMVLAQYAPPPYAPPTPPPQAYAPVPGEPPVPPHVEGAAIPVDGGGYCFADAHPVDTRAAAGPPWHEVRGRHVHFYPPFDLRLFAFRDGEWREIPLDDAREQGGLGTGAAVGDFDLDGRLELLIAHGESALQPLTLYRSQPNDNRYLRVLPRTAEGAPARGAIVTVRAGDRVWKRVIDAGSGYLCQMEPVAHFGLGTLDRVDEIEITFPTGRTMRFEHHDVNCLVELRDEA